MATAATLQRGAFPLFAYLNVASRTARTAEKPLFQAFLALCVVADTDKHCIKDGMKIERAAGSGSFFAVFSGIPAEQPGQGGSVAADELRY